MDGWTRANLRHAARMLHFGRRPAVATYESIGDSFFLAPAPGWLNLGWWDGPGDEAEASFAPARLVERIAEPLPKGGVILDVANGLGVQDAVIARIARPRALYAVNLTEFQLHAGRAAMASADARPVCADACQLPIASDSVDGLISVEAAFHFPSRARFFAEARRVLRPGGILSMSDISAEGRPHDVRGFVAAVSQVRLWGIKVRALATAGEIVHLAEQAGFEDVTVELCTARVVDPALRLTRARLEAPRAAGVPRLHVAAANFMLEQVQKLRNDGLIQYLLLRARAA